MLIVYHPKCLVRFSSIYIYNINALRKGLKLAGISAKKAAPVRGLIISPGFEAPGPASSTSMAFTEDAIRGSPLARRAP